MCEDRKGIHYKNVARIAQALATEKILTAKRMREILGEIEQV